MNSLEINFLVPVILILVLCFSASVVGFSVGIQHGAYAVHTGKMKCVNVDYDEFECYKVENRK